YKKGKAQQQVFTMTAFEGGSLLDALNEGRFKRTEVYGMLDALAENLERMHADNVIHRDLKPENVLFRRDEEGKAVVEISDFGLSYKADPKKKMVCTGYGTDAYTAPELFKNALYKPNYGYSLEEQKKHDIYALGLLAYQLLQSKEPGWFDVSDT